MSLQAKDSRLKVLICSLWLVVCSLLVGCSQALHKNTYVISGTYLEVVSSNPRAGLIVYDEFRRLDKIFNAYDTSSELFRLNSTYGISFKASKEMIELLELSKQLYDLTGGAFDVSCGSLYSFWKDLTKNKKIDALPSPEKIESLLERGSYDYIKVDPKEGTVLITKEGLKIDLAGIAKGYMVDRAILKLMEKGIKSALINAGGDIYCLGRRQGKPWVVGIRDPRQVSKVITNQELFNEAVATSGNYEQFFEFKNKRYSHIINPKTGYPVQNNILSVSVVAKNCTTADSLATAFYIMGEEKAEAFLSKNPSTIRVYIITKNEEEENISVLSASD